jgi:hypothetical protein
VSIQGIAPVDQFGFGFRETRAFGGLCRSPPPRPGASI